MDRAYILSAAVIATVGILSYFLIDDRVARTETVPAAGPAPAAD
jgi:hypothetical protein